MATQRGERGGLPRRPRKEDEVEEHREATATRYWGDLRGKRRPRRLEEMLTTRTRKREPTSTAGEEIIAERPRTEAGRRDQTNTRIQRQGRRYGRRTPEPDGQGTWKSLDKVVEGSRTGERKISQADERNIPEDPHGQQDPLTGHGKTPQEPRQRGRRHPHARRTKRTQEMGKEGHNNWHCLHRA